MDIRAELFSYHLQIDYPLYLLTINLLEYINIGDTCIRRPIISTGVFCEFSMLGEGEERNHP